MKKISILLIAFGVIWAGIFSLSGCAPALGPAFQRIDYISPGMGLVYIYRPAKTTGFAISYDVKANGTVVTTLYNGGYYPYFAKPGKIEFSAKTESTSSVTIDVQPGRTYYLKGTVGIGIVAGRPRLELASPEVAEKEIAECKLIPENKGSHWSLATTL